MGKHSVPRGEKSSYGQANSSPANNPNHKPKHAAQETTPSDIPHRDGRVDNR